MAKERGSKAAEHLGGKGTKKHKVHTAHVRKIQGGFHVRHEVTVPPGEQPPMPEELEHMVAEKGDNGMDALHQHLDDHMGNEPEPAPQPQQAA